MSRHLFTVSLALLFVAPAFVRADGGPRAIIERGIRAQGLSTDDHRPLASQARLKGRICSPVEDVHFTAESIQGTPQHFKLVLDVDVGTGARLHFAEVRNGSRGWSRTNDTIKDLDAARLQRLDFSDYIDRITGLVGLLREGPFQLTSVGEEKVAGRTADVVRVTAKGRPGVRLSFDRVSGLLLKTAYRDKDDEGDGREALHETFYSDYRELDYAAADEALLRTAGRGVDGPALLRLFRQQTLLPADRGALDRLVRQLGDRSFRQREQAADRLVTYGGAALALLRPAAQSADPEVARRAADCLRRIEAASGDQILAAAARLLALRRPPETAAVLLAYFPQAPSGPVAEEVQAALAAVARRDGRDDPDLVRALSEGDSRRRTAAAAALGRDGGAYARRPGRRIFVAGLKQPMKVLCRRDGENRMEWEVTDFQLFNRLDDRVFSRP